VKSLPVIFLMLLSLLLWRTEVNLVKSVSSLNRVVAGQQEDLYNLQRQIDGTYERGPLPKQVGPETPMPLVPHLHQHVGQAPRNN
jgi:hypothetical protein